MKTYSVIFGLCAVLILSSCKWGKVKSLESELAAKSDMVEQLESQLSHIQETNSSLLGTMSQLSVINTTEAKSIQSSLEALNKQNEYIRDLTDKIHEKDSINFVLVSNLKRSLWNVNDEDIQVEVRGSAVYVSIADKLLFQSGSAQISSTAFGILEKVATVINDHAGLNVMVEGHTDNVPIYNDKMKDNWDLSVLRATSVVRILQDRYGVFPERLTAAGRSEYVPKTDNQTSFGRGQNRRTEIVITPKLDQFFELLKKPQLVG